MVLDVNFSASVCSELKTVASVITRKAARFLVTCRRLREVLLAAWDHTWERFSSVSLN